MEVDTWGENAEQRGPPAPTDNDNFHRAAGVAFEKPD